MYAAVFYLIHLAAHPVSPVPGVDAAGNDRKQEHDSAACLKAVLRRKVIHVIVDYYLPVDAVNAASDDAEQNCQHNVPIFYHMIPRFLIVTKQSQRCSTCQIRSAYSAIERSAAKMPERATFKIAMRFQRSLS